MLESKQSRTAPRRPVAAQAFCAEEEQLSRDS